MSTITVPKVFIASSSKSTDYADKVKAKIENSNPKIEVETWQTDEVYKNCRTITDWLKEVNEHYNFGIFIFGKDDILNDRDANSFVVRDNVLFELGLFVGKHGLDNCFILAPRGNDFHFASDLSGIIIDYYDSTITNKTSAINSACSNIIEKIKTKWIQQQEQRYLQIGGIAYRIENGDIEFLLKKTNSNRWVFPKVTPSSKAYEETELKEVLKTEGFIQEFSNTIALPKIKYYREANDVNKSTAAKRGIPDSLINESHNGKDYYAIEVMPYLVHFDRHTDSYAGNADKVYWGKLDDVLNKLAANRELGKKELWEVYVHAFLEISKNRKT